MKRRSFLASTAALAVIPFLPAKEVWHYRGIEVVVNRLPDYVGMFFYAPDGRKFGIGRLTQLVKTDKTQEIACRRTIDRLLAV